MRGRRNVPEIVIEAHELLRRSQTRINLLFTMSEIPHAHPVGRDVRSDVSRTMYSSAWVCSIYHLGCATRSPEGEAWWSQTGSNRRPHACKARALPAELWPHFLRRLPVVALRAMPGTLHSIVSRGCATRSQRRSVVGLGRLELPTSRLSSARSNQLSYKPLTLILQKDRVLLARTGSHQCIAQALSPWRVFVREERET